MQTHNIYKRIVFCLVILFSFVNAHAVFEGNTKPNDLPGVRNNVEVAPIETQSQKAQSSDAGQWGGGTPVNGDDGPISDSPLFFLLLGGLGCSAYIFVKKRKTGKA